MKNLMPLPDFLLEEMVSAALREDLGRAGDLTTAALGAMAARPAKASFVARQAGTIAGLDLARLAFRRIDPALTFTLHVADGDRVAPGTRLADVAGAAGGILTAERVALNFLCHLSGIATETQAFVEAVRPYPVAIVDTRKTLPGLRAVQKYAVRAGGGGNHRFGLDDAVLIKDNHVALAGGIGAAIEAVRANVGHLVKIEVEVDTLDQLAEALRFPIDAVLLDNMTPEQVREAVQRTAGRVLLEASGGVTLATVATLAATGVDLISSGALTHSARALDIGLDMA
jgi:nicotinate-nucleotide pyrophosphorylase (carboxylating)